jgi:hypothetical protein
MHHLLTELLKFLSPSQTLVRAGMSLKATPGNDRVHPLTIKNKLHFLKTLSYSLPPTRLLQSFSLCTLVGGY